jgi:Uma2 family endonuclease
MPSVKVQPRVSYADLQRLPEDGPRYELYDGEVFVIPSPIPWHQIVVNNLKRLVEDYSSRNGGISLISPIDIVFSEHNVVQPDIVYFLASRRHLIDLFAPIRNAPDLAVEVLSPETRGNDLGRKKWMFTRFQVPEYWIVDPDACCIEVHALARDEYALIQTACGSDILRSRTITGLSFAAADAFRMP